ncbi:hypothetical protein VU08_06180, partial [Desulfobulbus sp. F5]|nr:hypothetical protein [Desulfobulbus sp. F5]
ASTLFFVLTKQRQLLRMGYHLRGYLNHLSKEKRHGNDSMETGSQRPHHAAVVQNPFRAAHVLLLADTDYQGVAHIHDSQTPFTKKTNCIR